MTTNIGEYIAGAYLKLCDDEIDFVDYNVRAPNGRAGNQTELDIIGLNIQEKVAHLCEVATHINGLGYKTPIKTVKEKHNRQKLYAEKYLNNFKTIRYSFWSPYVPIGKVTKGLEKIEGLELIINQEYDNRVNELKELAKSITSRTGNPYFRMLQIEQSIHN